ncbi:GcvT family protein [Micrococcoides hystricis]|uniref:FAD-dependent oxidoreductase n=1 Tax=Micrococcoides hystricis TaxID=1572761 RepID=A0ABV6PCD9_9MICC
MHTPRVVIIGAGIVGANLAEELCARGWTNITVLDQGPIPLTGGSTSHAPGLVFQANPSRTMTRLASYTAEKLASLTRNGVSAFNPVGGLEIATTPERLAELHRRANFAALAGVDAQVIDADQARTLNPLLAGDGDGPELLGALHVPSDGLASALLAVELLIERATDAGATFLPHTRVTAIEERGGRVSAVRAGEHRIPADIVVCCGGFWGPELGEMIGMPIPLVPMAHQYATTTAVPQLTELASALPANLIGSGNNATLPLIRHQDADLYYRQHGDAIGIGSYAHRPMPTALTELPDGEVTAENMPSMLAFTPADFAPQWAQSQKLLPALRTAELATGFNGIFSFTPDGGSLVGEAPQLKGCYLAEAVWVTHSAGVAKSLAELLVDGYSHVDLRELDINRFEQVQLTEDYVAETAAQSFIEVYDIKHPLEPRTSPRNLRTSPFFDRQQQLGAYFLEAHGWERPHWYQANEHLLQQLPADWLPPARDSWAAQHSSPISAAEAYATRTNVAMYDMTPLKHLEVTGPGSLALLESLTTSIIDKPGERKFSSVTYTLLLNDAGRIRSDITVTRWGEEHFQIGANTGIDTAYLTERALAFNAANPDAEITVTDVTDQRCCIGLWGPNAREMLRPLTDQDLSNAALGYFRAASTTIAGIPVKLLRLSYVGELGWEIYADAEHGLALWDTLWDAGQPLGLIAAGRGAFNGLRLEKGYRSWGADMNTEHDPDQAGLAFAVSAKKADFIGKTALQHRRQDSATAQPVLRCLLIDDPAQLVMGHEPVFVGGRCVGYTTSADYGYTVHAPLAYAWLEPELGIGDAVQIRYFDTLVPARIVAEPLIDPDMLTIRADDDARPTASATATSSSTSFPAPHPEGVRS